MKPKIDVHIHVAGTGCHGSGCWVSPQFRSRYTFKLLKMLLGVTEAQLSSTIDQDWIVMIHNLVRESRIDFGVILGFDGVYHHSHGDINTDQSQMIIPHRWVFEAAKQYRNLLPGPSVNPFKKDALKELEDCIEQGAVLIKWLPCTQAIDPASASIKEYYQLLARHGVPLLIHMGGERTFKEVAPEYNNVKSLKLPLSLGVKVICAHSATRIIGSSERDQLDDLRRLLKEYPHLWVDNSGMCNPGRFAHAPRLARDELINSRTLYGSDWPVPSNSFYYVRELGFKEVLRLEKIKNLIDRDSEIKSILGYPEETFTRAADVLANLDRWLTAT
jgi:predicted TIM-barrel fold metal-dependent hydrolase